MPPEEHETLYGDRSGRWLLIRGPLGVLPPPALVVGIPLRGTVELTFLGPPGDVVMRLYNWLTATVEPGRQKGNQVQPVQDILGTVLGVGQQSVSRYLNGTSQPRLPPEGWSRLVRGTFDPASVAILFPRPATAPEAVDA